MPLYIITDSASDLPQEIRNKYHVPVIPTPVTIGQTDYLDGLTIHPLEFYKILDKQDREITTYHINPSMFEEAFTPYAQRGDQVIYLCFSTGIAGTFNSANIARANLMEQYPDFDITIVDSRCASAGFGLMVYKLLMMKEHGADKQLLLEASGFYSRHIRHVFTVQTLKYLIKGGRLSYIKGYMGETLDLKPIITIDSHGALKVIRTVRGRKKSLCTLVEYARETGADWDNQAIAYCHGDDTAAIGLVQELMHKAVPYKNSYVSLVGCAIGAHTGRGIVGICYLDTADTCYRDYLDE